MVRVHQLEIIAGIGIADHELKSIGPEISGPFPLTVPGNKLPDTVDSSANLWVQYTQPIGNDLSFIGGIDYSRLGKTYWTLDNVHSEPTYNLVNARLSLEWERCKLTGVIENLFDEE